MLLDQAGSERRAKVAARKTNNELLLAAIGTPRASGTHGRQRALTGGGEPSTTGDACGQR